MAYKNMKTKLIKIGKTNNGDQCKQVIKIIGHKPEEIALIIYKLIFTDNRELYESDFTLLRKFKDKYLFEQVFVIRLNTLGEIVGWLNSNHEGITKIRQIENQ